MIIGFNYAYLKYMSKYNTEERVTKANVKTFHCFKRNLYSILKLMKSDNSALQKTFHFLFDPSIHGSILENICNFYKDSYCSLGCPTSETKKFSLSIGGFFPRMSSNLFL